MGFHYSSDINKVLNNMAGRSLEEETEDESKQLIDDQSQISDRKLRRLSPPADR